MISCCRWTVTEQLAFHQSSATSTTFLFVTILRFPTLKILAAVFAHPVCFTPVLITRLWIPCSILSMDLCVYVHIGLTHKSIRGSCICCVADFSLTTLLQVSILCT